MSESINDRIKIAREKLGLKQFQVAERMNMKETTYSQMERSGNINSERLLMLSEILEVSIDYLIKGEEKLDFTPPQKKTVVLRDRPFGPDEPEIILTQTEKSIITVMRNFPESIRSEVIDYITKKYKETKHGK